MDKGGNTTHWHSIDASEVLNALATSTAGLNAEKVLRHRLEYQTAPETNVKRTPLFVLFASQFLSPFVWLLLIACIFSAAVGDIKDAAVILVVLLANSLLGTIFTRRSENLAASLQKKLHLKAVVRRDGKLMTIPQHQLVVGDIVCVTAGSEVTADIRLISSNYLRVNESMLTGEVLPVSKSIEAVPSESRLPERSSLLFAGTTVSAGSGEGVVVALGSETEVGAIQATLATASPPDSPLVQQTKELNTYVAIGAAVLAGLVFLSLLRSDVSLVTAFEAAAALMVAAVPEGLPILVTTGLLMGIASLAKQQALVKSLTAIETLSHVSTIVTDKTGTLTTNTLTPTSVLLFGKERLEEHNTQTINPFTPGMGEVLMASVLANETTNADATSDLTDPLESTLLRFASQFHTEGASVKLSEKRESLIPFSSEYKLTAASYRTGTRERIWYVKGAPEQILSRCSHVYSAGIRKELTTAQRDEFITSISTLSAEGDKLLAFATLTDGRQNHRGDSVEHELHALQNMTLIGAVSLHDPLRAESRRTVEALYEEGISLKIASGDHASTTKAIAHAIRLPVHELRGSLQEAQARELVKATVFPRVSPLEKLTLITTLQKRGHVVAMIGDGSNDAPALKQADVGIALGKSGTDVSRGAASVVLLNDSLRTVLDAVRKGRSLTYNIQSVMLFLLVTNAVEAVVITVGTLFGGASQLLTPGQVLWLNLLSDTPLAIPFLFESLKHVPKRAQHHPSKKKISFHHDLIPLAILSGAGLAVATLITHFMSQYLMLAEGERQALVLITLVFGQVFVLLTLRQAHESVFMQKEGNIVLRLCVGVVVTLLFAALTIPILKFATDLETPSLPLILIAALLSGITLVGAEIHKHNQRAQKRLA